MTYSLGVLPDDPSQERVLVEVIENPNWMDRQVRYCLDAITVPNEGVAIRCEGPAWMLHQYRYTHPGEHPDLHHRGGSGTSEELRERRKAEKANGLYRPTLREVQRDEQAAERRRANNAEWMRKHRASSRHDPQPVACSHCGASFTPKRSTARFCSTACRVAAHRASRALQP